MRTPGVLVAGALCAACGGTVHAPPPAVATWAAPTPSTLLAEPEPPAASGAARIPGSPAPGDARPVVHTLAFDVGALPRATWGAPSPDAGFTLRKVRDGWSLWVRTTLFAEVVVSATASYQASGTSPVGFSSFTAGSFGAGEPPDCGPGHTGKRLAVWKGMSPKRWTEDGVNVEMNEGDYDLATCSAAPIRSLRGRARAVLPGYVYAIRVRDGDDEDGPQTESVVFFLPRGALVSATEDPETPVATTNTGTFTRLSFPLEEGTAASASVRLSPASLRLWSRLREAGNPIWNFEDGSAPHDDLLLGIDVVRQGEATHASLTLALPKGGAPRAYAKLLAAAAIPLPK